MRRQYSIAVLALCLAGAAAFAAAPCPPEITAVAREVARLRAVPPPFAPPCRLITAATLPAELDRKLRRDLPISPLVFLESLRRLGLMSEEPAAVYPRLLEFYASQVLGFYEPATDELVVVSDPPAGELAAPMVWSHELAHAAQEHRFRLPSRLLAMGANGDAQRAASGVAEGEAMLVMVLLADPATGQTLDAATASVREEAASMPRPPGVPDYFVDDLVFPYTTGFTAVAGAFRAGGWGAVNDLLLRPPDSTTALLHPGRRPTAGRLGDASLPPVPPGYEAVLSDTVGEWGLAFWLARRLPAAQAGALAAGWDGDRLRLVRGRSDSGRWALAWRLRCRTAAERASLQAALEREMPHLLRRLTGGTTAPELVWQASGRELELLAGWP